MGLMAKQALLFDGQQCLADPPSLGLYCLQDAMLRQYQQEIARLRAELARPENQTPPLPPPLPSPLPQPPLADPAARPSSAAAAQTEAATDPGSRIYADMAAGPAEPAPASPAASVGLQAAVVATPPAVGTLQAEMEAQVPSASPANQR